MLRTLLYMSQFISFTTYYYLLIAGRGLSSYGVLGVGLGGDLGISINRGGVCCRTCSVRDRIVNKWHHIIYI